MTIKKLDIITLDDKEYVVIDVLNYDDKEYYIVNLIDEDENLIDDVRIMFKDENSANKGLFLTEVKNLVTKEELLKIYQQKYC